MADATDLKSVGTSMRVRVPPRAFQPFFEKNEKTERKEWKNQKKLQKTAFFRRNAQ